MNNIEWKIHIWEISFVPLRALKNFVIGKKRTDLYVLLHCFMPLLNTACFLMKLWTPPPPASICKSNARINCNFARHENLNLMCWNANLQVGQSVCWNSPELVASSQQRQFKPHSWFGNAILFSSCKKRESQKRRRECN